MSDDPFAPVPGHRSPGKAAKADADWEIIMPVPPDAPPAPTQHPTLGAPTLIHPYLNADNQILHYVHRYDVKGGKEHRPLSYQRPTRGGAPEWRWAGPSDQRPLYNLGRLAERPSAPVVVC
jgi:putative DNA primase/helicase